MNQYDDDKFFELYGEMQRSKEGLKGAGEWTTLQSLLPDFKGNSVLDLGCGYGWHCRYAAENGASSVLGIDTSEKMLTKAQSMTHDTRIQYQLLPIEQLNTLEKSFNIILSSLAIHYIADFDSLLKTVYQRLAPSGFFIFNVEHPIFTAQGSEDWIYDNQNQPVYWPVDHYFAEGQRDTKFLGAQVTKYHRTLTTYINGMLHAGFILDDVVEPQPPETMMNIPGMQDELRRPMMLIIKGHKA